MTPSLVRRAADLLPPPRECLLPLLSAFLLVLSFPPFELLLPPFVSLVPFLVFLSERPAGPYGRWSSARAGFVLGTVYFGLLLYWMVVALIYYSLLAIPAYVLSVLVLACMSAGFAALTHYAHEHVGVPIGIAAAVFWTALEWIQGHLGDLAFPWLGLGTSLSGFPRVSGAADLVGASGLTFWLALVNGLLAEALIRFRADRRVVAYGAAAAVVAALPIAYGFWRAATLELRPVARVALIQPNIPEDLKLDRSRAVDSSLTALANLTLQVEKGSVDLVLWPEVAIPAAIEHPYEAWLQRPIRDLSAAAGAPILAGAYGVRRASRDDFRYFNSAYLVTADVVGPLPYHKQYLVPFVERVPFLEPALLERLVGKVRYFGALESGTSTRVFSLPRAGWLGILICYESIFPGLSRKYRRESVDYLVNITNDAWYGREPWWARTSALWQHPAHLVLRAIETRIGIARAANTGISMFIDPVGRTYERTELFVPTVRTGTVYTTDAITLFVRYGDWLATSVTIAAVLLYVLARFRDRRSARLARRHGPAEGLRS